SSSDPSVASITSEGMLTANATGSTSVTVKASAGGLSVSSSVSVSVTDATRVRLVPVEDSFVQSTAAGTNYGSSSGLLSKPSYGGSPDRIAYFKFDVSGLAGKTVTSAVLSTSNQITDGSLDVARGDF
ncbi:DNRLRE domain-containing protein, partial [Pseudomonas tremae]|uniref:CBM96 family carbohydrate-binding protein n=1 Tax=Pseudomonas tremae TaxID=200454 RepID=UPI00210D11EB